MDSFEHKTDRINNMTEKNELNNDDWDIVTELAKHENSEVRYRIAGMLAMHHAERSEEILKSMINDIDPMVRVNVCDSLAFSRSADTLALLMKYAANDDIIW